MDNLLGMVSSWLDDQRACASQLRKLAKEVDMVTLGCYGGKAAGATMGVGAGVSLVGAAVTVLTGGVAAPWLALVAAGLGAAGAVTTLPSDMIEKMKTSESLKEAERLARRSHREEEAIRRELQRLVQQGGEGAAPPRSSEDAVNCIMRAMDYETKGNWCVQAPKEASDLIETLWGLFCLGWAAKDDPAFLILKAVPVAIKATLFPILALRDLFCEGLRFYEQVGCDVSVSLRESARMIESAAADLKRDIDGVRR